MYVSLRNLLRLCYCSGLVAAVSVANAQVSNVAPVATRSGNSFSVSYPSGGAPVASSARTVGAGSSAGTFTVTDALQIAGPAGFLPVAVTRGVTAAAVGTALAEAGAAATGIGLAALGIGAYQLFQDYQIRKASSGNGFEMDPGGPAQSVDRTTYKVSGFNGAAASSSVAACNAYAATQYAGQYSKFIAGVEYHLNYKMVGYVETTNATYCNVDGYTQDGVLTYPGFRHEVISSATTSDLSCIEAATGATLAARSDGLCPTGRYEGASNAAVASKLASAMTVDAVKDYINSGTSAAHPVAQSSPTAITGPASQVGTSSTSITNSGNVTTTTTNTPTYNYTYGGTTVNYVVTNGGTTTTTNTATGTSTTETTTKPETTIPGLCDLFPSISACAQLDMPDAPDPLPTVPYVPSITPHVFGSSATCPAPITLSFPRLSFVVSWQPLCDLATGFLSPIVGFLSLFAAVKVFFSGFRV